MKRSDGLSSNDQIFPNEHCLSEREDGLLVWSSEWRSYRYCAEESARVSPERKSLAQVAEKEGVVFQY